ncbi:hypothetical protein E2562_006901 [Oryza meyeriana var. granulata]|uniref:Uncharacterized protein n=1 Tax=Oryza meyeriana var. granulata TaxID=110450 RepID=A0A6G1BJ01_9ORYZ|nr:hypothetical protein E2562_006901 [Oryza meyeriana var. granulata]
MAAPCGMEDDWPYPLLCRDIDARYRARQMSSGRPNDLTVFCLSLGCCKLDGITMRKKLATVMDKIEIHGV